MSRDGSVLTVALDWIEHHCVVPDGFRIGERFRPYDYQFRYLANFYRVRSDVEFDSRNPVLAPAFVYRRGLLVGPQKLGKNPLVAAQVCLEGAGPALFAGWAGRDDGYACSDWGCGCGYEWAYEPGEPMGMPWPTPLIQVTAFSKDSTENTYDALRPMIDRGPLADVITRTGEEFIRLPGGGRIDTVSSSARSRLGQRVTFAPQDEVGLWTHETKMVKLADTQYRGLAGMGGRASLTTNAWDPSDKSVAQQQFESSAKDIYRQFVQPPKSLSFTNKRERRKIYHIVYPDEVLRENGGHLDLDAVEAEAVDLMERDEAQAQRFFGNLLVSGAGRAVEAERWDDLARPTGPDEDLEDGVPSNGTYIGLGFDGSISDDATILRGCTREGWSFIVAKWVRPGGPRGEGWRVPRLEVDSAVREAFARWHVGRMLCDPAKWWSEIEAWAREHGDDTVLFFDTNSDRRMGIATDRWLTGIRNGSHTHDDDPTTNEHVVNAHKRKARAKDPDDDNRTLYVLTKPDEGAGKIDAAVADVLAFEAAMSMPDEPAVTANEPFVLITD